MRDCFKSYLTKVLGCGNVFPTRMTNQAELRSLLMRLHPKLIDMELIRLGPNGDGGYLLPDVLEGIVACFSPGVSGESGFEKDCADRGMKVFLADKSVDQPAEEHELFQFTKKFVGATSNQEFMTLDDWVEAELPEQESGLLLQMDIEGYEYEVVLSTSKSLMKRFRVIIAEFHHLDQLWSAPFFNLASSAFDKILHTHSCVHIHPNNCCGLVKKGGLEIPRVMEFTFLRSDYVRGRRYQTTFPNPLDCDNRANNSLPLPSCWFRNE